VCASSDVNARKRSVCRPEFLNRLDEIIVFRQLTKQEVKQIADIMLKQVFLRAEEKGIKIDVTGEACSYVICFWCIDEASRAS
jgi:ATP-dependent Clp protease ATP-binding subunit ClpA